MRTRVLRATPENKGTLLMSYQQPQTVSRFMTFQEIQHLLAATNRLFMQVNDKRISWVRAKARTFSLGRTSIRQSFDCERDRAHPMPKGKEHAQCLIDTDTPTRHPPTAHTRAEANRRLRQASREHPSASGERLRSALSRRTRTCRRESAQVAPMTFSG
jgi:hypothetical protein